MGRVSGSRYRAKMKAKDVFDACYGRYRSLHEWLEDATGKVRASRDIRGGRRADTPANTSRIRALGRGALRRPEWKGRLKLFEIYYLHTMEYKNAILRRLRGRTQGTARSPMICGRG